MTVRNPIVLINGQLQELPAGDTVNGATGGGTTPAVSEIDGGTPTTPTDAYQLMIDFGGPA